MKKVLFVAFMVMAFVALGSLAIFAGGKECSAAKTADAKAAGCCPSKAGTTSASATKVDATMASSKTTTANGAACSVAEKGAVCTTADKAACAAKLTGAKSANACTIDMCLKECEAKHAEICGEGCKDHVLTAMSIKGMTCAGCETNVTTALMAVEGVNKVIEVCHKAGFAVVCAMKDAKFSSESAVKAVSAKGFESQIIPAVAVTTTNTTEKAECEAHKKDGSK